MPFETLSSIDLATLSKRDLKAICVAIRTETGKSIDLRANCETLIQYIEDYRNSITPPLLAQLEEVEAVEEVTTPNLEEIEIVNEAPVTSSEETEKQNQFFTLVNVIGDAVANECEMTVSTDNLTDLLRIKSIKDILTWSWERRTTQSAGALLSCLYHNPHLLTTQGLSTLLAEVNLMLGGETPKHYPTLGKPHVLKDLADIPRASEAPNAAIHRQLRYTIRDLQLHLGISAIKPVTRHGISYLDYDSHLALLPEDKQLLKAEAPKLAKQYIERLDMKPPCIFVRVDEEDNIFETSINKLTEYANNAVYGWVYEDRQHLVLCLAMQWDGNEAFDYQVFRLLTPELAD